MSNHRVAVVIVNYNAGDMLTRCITALKQQTRHPDRIVIVDNASVDQSLEPLKKFYPNVEIIEMGYNSGFAVANNHAFNAITDCDWIALLNPDAFPEPNWLEQLLNATQIMPDYTFFASRMLTADDASILDGAGDCYYAGGLMMRRGYLKPAANAYLVPEEVFGPCGGAALYRRDILLAAQGFDEDFFCYCEDVDLAFRLRLLGYRCWYVPTAIVKHIGSAITGRRSDFTIYHGHRNLVWTYVKNMPGVLFWWYLPKHLLVNFYTLYRMTKLGQAKTIFKAKWDALKGLTKMWRKRQQIQAQRKVPIEAIWQQLVRSFLK